MCDVSAVRVEWAPSSNGHVMREVPGSEFRMKVDMVVLAMGFEPALPAAIAEPLDMKCDERGKPIVKEFATSVDGVFAAGDLVTGASYVVTAIDSGRKAAEKIHAYLTERVAKANA